MQLTISFLVIFAILADLTSAENDSEDNTNENDFTFCLEYIGCIEDGGFAKIEHCVGELGYNDLEFAMDFFREEYQNPNANLSALRDEGCDDTERAKKTFDEYYDAKKERDQEEGVTPEDEDKLQKCRNCFLANINECSAKRRMGMM